MGPERAKERYVTEAVYEQGSGALNEDTLLMKGNVFGVFDGASSIDYWKDQSGKTGGFLAANIVKEIMEKGGEEQPLREQLLAANERLAEKMQIQGIDITKKSNRWAVAAAAIRAGNKKFEWAQIGDSRILVIYKDGSYKTLGSNIDFDVESLVLWKSLVQRGERSAFDHQEMHKQMVKVREKSNIDYGFLNGESEVEQFLASGEEPLENIASILIFTDGLTIPKEDPTGEDSLDKLVKLYQAGGLKKVKDFIREEEQKDPEFQKYTRFKPHDDIAAIAVNL